MRRIQRFEDVLVAARAETGGVRPGPADPNKGRYAMHFANSMAVLIANRLRPHFTEVKPDPFGRGVESPAQALHGLKKLDVNYSTLQAGLGLGVSLKSVHVRDREAKHRFHHNMKRNDEELRAEAAAYHQRQPYAVLVAVLFLPFEACEDADARRASSFGTWVKYLWPLCNRSDTHGDFDLFERVFVALYDPEDANLGLFDVKTPPPRKGRPPELLTLDDLIRELVLTYERRNQLDFCWAEGEDDDI